jgi:dihydroxycyclohexadiene carboxylate dehydrogenase
MMSNQKVLDFRAHGARRFENKICIVAGAGQGIGSATARRFAQEGGTVVVADIVKETADNVCQELRDFGATAIPFIADLTKREGCVELINYTKREYGRIDALANIVGGTIWGKWFWNYEPEQIEAEVNKSFWPSLWLCWAACPVMLEQKSGAIVNLSTHAVASTYRVPYAAAKGGVMALTTSLAKELAPHNVRVNVVAPHATTADDRVTTRTHGYDSLSRPLTDAETKEIEEITNQRRKFEIPMGRKGLAEEQAAAIVFLASDDASFITGQILPVGGGATYPF